MGACIVLLAGLFSMTCSVEFFFSPALVALAIVYAQKVNYFIIAACQIPKTPYIRANDPKSRSIMLNSNYENSF